MAENKKYKEQVLLGVDLGATSIKAAAFGLDGSLVASASERNAPIQQPGGEDGWFVWDADDIWGKVCACLQRVVRELASPSQVGGISVDGFGVDGAPVDENGALLYPLSSWHDSRNTAETEWLSQQLDPYEIYKITGYHNYSIQTANRMRWLVVHEPDVLKNAYRYLMTQDFLVHRLSGEFTTEVTMASTSLLLDIANDEWSDTMFETIGVDKSIMPKASESGRKIGEVTPKASEQTGIPAGTPVATGGHDCEIGTLGAGVTDPATFVDITGTWEMAIAILDEFTPSQTLFEAGIDWERHCLPGQYLCQSLMIAGGVVEWMGKNFYPETSADTLYGTMIREASAFGPGSGGIAMLPSFMRGMGPFQKHGSLGAFLGITTTTERGQIMHAAFEAMCFQLAKQIEVIENNTGTSCERLRTLGGVQKNEFWLQMKADVTGRPVETIDNPEVTLLGAAILAGIGAGIYENEQDALSQMDFPVHEYTPDMTKHEDYMDWYERVFSKIAPSLEGVFAEM